MKSKRFEKTVKVSVTVFMLFVTTLIVAGIAVYLYFAHDLPSIENLKNYKPSAITRFYSEEGEVVGEFFIEKREVVPLERMPHHLIQSFVAGEDSRFFQHKGVDYMAIIRALSRNLFSGEIVQGGSTITQQVVKSLLLSPERKFTRKIREAILAFKIENYLSKEEILYLYLNQIYLGHGTYGVAVAAQDYFGKPVEELTLAESAILAGLPRAPNRNSPLAHPEQAKRRQSYTLNRMVEEGMISYGESMKALKTPLKFKNRHEASQDQAPHFVEHVRRYIEEKYGKDALYKNGLQVYTTVDTRIQKSAQDALEAGLKEIEKREKYKAGDGPVPEGSLVSFDLESGYIKAMVGGRDFKKSQFNRATQAKRQTGSSFKPIVYASALDKGYTPATIIIDSPIVFDWGGKIWKPKNFEGKFMGPTTLRNALTHSVNVVTVKIAQDVGIDYIKDYAKKMGIFSPLQGNLSMALGSSSITLYEMTKAYAIFANQGNLFKPIFIKKILDRDGNLLEENLPLFYPREIPEEEKIISPQTAFLMTHLLESVVQNGTGYRAKSLGRPVAAKTGTTDDYMDAWFIGYTPELCTGVWVGFDEEQSLGNNETGSRAASPIWVDFMSKTLKGKPMRNFSVPEGIEFMKIDPQTGQNSLGKEAVLECFKEGTGPVQKSPAPAKSSSDFFKFDFNLSDKPK